ITQTIQLNPGWNAVYLTVQPEVRSTTDIFKPLNVESVWMWNRQFSTVQFIQNPDLLKPDDADWLVHFPQGGAAPSTLHSLLGGHTYLIKLRVTPSLAWPITGPPYVFSPKWLPDSFNFVGFSFGSTPPAFGVFFAPAPGHNLAATFRLLPTGEWQRLTLP